MTDNEKLLTVFYTAFQSKDYRTMQKCYASQAVFMDTVFKKLDSEQAKAMWEMLLRRSKELEVSFRVIEADSLLGSAEWTATYTYTPTGRRVVNHVVSHFMFDEGRIVHHYDHFDFYKWSCQALGASGWLLGWSPPFKSYVQRQARKKLFNFMKKE